MSAVAAMIAMAILIQPGKLFSQAQNRVAEVWIGGDVNLGDGGRGQIKNIASMVQGAAGIVNVEGPVGEKTQLIKGRLRLWNAPQSLGELAATGVRVAGIANNHAGDAGPRGEKRSAAALIAHGLLPSGGPAGAAKLSVNGIKIVVTAHDLTAGVPKGLKQELSEARAQADVLIATFHVTSPPSYLPSRVLKQAVDIAYKTGAGVIAAHGSHALARVERRGHAVIAWGLGNLAFACDCTGETDAMILRVRLEPGKEAQAQVMPIRAGLNQAPAAPARDASAVFDLLEAIGSSRLQRHSASASF